MTLLSRFIKSPPLNACSNATDAAQSSVPRLVKIERAGNVLHVFFSPIRKTHRVSRGHSRGRPRQSARTRGFGLSEAEGRRPPKNRADVGSLG